MLVVKQTLIILFAASLVILAAVFLANTEWADGFRTGKGHGPERTALTQGDRPDILGSGEGEQAVSGRVHGEPDRQGSTASRFLMSFLEIIVKIGIPALVTICLIKTGKRFFRSGHLSRNRADEENLTPSV